MYKSYYKKRLSLLATLTINIPIFISIYNSITKKPIVTLVKIPILATTLSSKAIKLLE